MKVKRFPTVSTTTNTTYFTDPIKLERYPFEDQVTVQVTHLGSSATTLNNNITLQIRPYPDLNWVDVGSAVAVNGSNAATVGAIFVRKFPCAEYRLKIVRATAAAGTTGTVNAWIGR